MTAAERGAAHRPMDDILRAIYVKSPQDWTDDEVRRICEATDDDLMRFAGSASFVPIIEAMRRLRERVGAEEGAIRRLTWWLVAFTFTLVLLTGALVYVAVLEYRPH